MNPLRTLFTYPLCYAVERTVIRSQTFEKTWTRLRPQIEQGIEIIAQQAHPQGRSVVRKYVFNESAIRRIVNECLRQMFSTEIMMMVNRVQTVRRNVSKRKAQIIEWEKDMIGAPKKSWNPLNFSQTGIKEKITKAEVTNAQDERQIQELIDTSLESLRARGVNLNRAQLEGLINTAEGEDVAGIMAVADNIKQLFQRMESQLHDNANNPELAKTYAGFYMMCCRLYLEAIDRALLKIEKTYLPKVSGISNTAKNQIRKAEKQLQHPKITEQQTQTLNNNVAINNQIIAVANFYTTHLNTRAKDLLGLRDKAQLNFDISVNTFMTMKMGSDLAVLMKTCEQDFSKIFDFESPNMSSLYDIGFGEQFKAVTRQLQNN